MAREIVEIKEFSDFTRYIAEMQHHYWVFRGHGNVAWRIESTLARYYRSHEQNIPVAGHYPRELDAINKFKKSSHLHLTHLPAESDYLSWLAVMQHFGAPTRLVDFTHSPFVALFFALESAAPEVKFNELLSRKELNKRYAPYDVHAVHLKSVRVETARVLGHDKFPENADFKIGRGMKQSLDFISFFEGSWQNQRQVAQQGLFMVPSMIGLDIESLLEDCPGASKSFPNITWFTFRFPGGIDSYSEMVARLLQANVTAESLFPGLEGVARSLRMRYYEPKINLR